MTAFTNRGAETNQPAAAPAETANVKSSAASKPSSVNEVEDDEDAWDNRIKKTGCFKENEALLICHADTNDWRKCLAEMNAFRQCMKQNGHFDPNA
ncbi:hypothetical protein IW150_004707 [Coemansia sp. RSA 2607]|nr:hypothetical protein IW150_004707 [Coemansia sp. RSA 2607]